TIPRSPPQGAAKGNAPADSGAFNLALQSRSEIAPCAAVPIAAAFMLVPAVIITLFPTPIIRVDRDVEFGAILIVGLDVPTIAFLIADDACGGARAGDRQEASPHHRGKNRGA